MNVMTFSRNAFLCTAVFLSALALAAQDEMIKQVRPILSLQERIDELAAKGGGTLVLKPGVYETGALFFKPGVNLHLEKGATILGVDDAEGYPMRETRIEGETCLYYPALVNADGCDGFTISGEGVIDGHGLPTWKQFWELRKAKPKMLNKDPSLVRPRLLYVSNSKNVDVSGVTFKNSKFWTTHFYRCENVRVHDCEIVAEVIDDVRGPSTDAIDIDVCRNFVVSNVVMDVNDDAVVVKGGKGLEANDYAKFPENGPSEGIVVENCLFKSVCHSCLTLGSECPAVTNVVMRNCRLDGPGNFVNVKMRDDTPQDYSRILVENCRGTCRKIFNGRAWKQFSTVKDGGEPPISRLSDFTMRGNTVVAAERLDSFRDRSFIRFSNCRFEDGATPAAVSAKLSEQFLSTSPDAYHPSGCRGKAYGGNEYVHYSVVSLWVNALECARLNGDTNLVSRLVAAFDPAYGDKRGWMNDYRHVDLSIVGAIPLEIAILTGDARAKELGLRYAERQWEEPREGLNWGERWYDPIPLAERHANWGKGYSPETRLWIDDMYMITFLQSQAYRLTGERKYIDRAGKEMCMYLEKLQRADGLFNHAPGAPFAWGRGNGWMAAAMAMNLKFLPADSEWREPILARFRKMMAALLKWQRSNGLWGQLVDDGESYDETSATAMFAYAFAEGANAGVLGDEYMAAAKSAYAALVPRLDEHGNLPDVCVGTGWKNDRHHYLTRPKANGDPHGQAPLLWLCRALAER